jgi:hypothetical protein
MLQDKNKSNHKDPKLNSSEKILILYLIFKYLIYQENGKFSISH